MQFKTDSRRRHGADLKARVLSECERPGASVAAIAMAHGLNANLVHKWRRKIRDASQSTAAIPAIELAPFIALPLTTAPAPPERAASAPPDIRIELRRAALTVNITWPVDAADKCAALLRELLR
jgi:transposase